ncbi:MAG: DUF2442 domain-containing protein [Bacteroidota bacterium]
MIKVVEVKAIERFKIWAKFNDGVEGTVDLSEFVGKGVFKVWDDPGVFENVKAQGSGIEWNENLDIDAFNVYLTITNQTFEE